MAIAFLAIVFIGLYSLVKILKTQIFRKKDGYFSQSFILKLSHL
ncbi:MAG: hypothetical protein N4J56_004239 [Chroococcidiopsis sp. SAG 2025]|nr:hypothetical protein [Chroococcidiopsis sp. SAG 2025]